MENWSTPSNPVHFVHCLSAALGESAERLAGFGQRGGELADRAVGARQAVLGKKVGQRHEDEAALQSTGMREDEAGGFQAQAAAVDEVDVEGARRAVDAGADAAGLRFKGLGEG